MAPTYAIPGLFGYAFEKKSQEQKTAVIQIFTQRRSRALEENQISNIIRRTKGKRTLKIHQFYDIQRQKIPERIRISLENHSSPTENSKKSIFLNEKPIKTEN